MKENWDAFFHIAGLTLALLFVVAFGGGILISGALLALGVCT